MGNCRLCGKEVEYGFIEICLNCLKKIERTNEKICSLCGRDLPEISTTEICGECLIEAPPYKRHISLFYYDGAIRELLLLYKIGKRHQLSTIFGRSIAKEVKSKFKGVDFDFVTFVPSPFLRSLLRGFSPAELIAKECSKKMKIPLKRVLYFNKSPKPQKGLNRKQRIENVKSAFKCKEDLEGKKILLIDDIFTTGSTLYECSKAVKKAKGEIYCITFAIRKKRDVDLISENGIND